MRPWTALICALLLTSTASGASAALSRPALERALGALTASVSARGELLVRSCSGPRARWPLARDRRARAEIVRALNDSLRRNDDPYLHQILLRLREDQRRYRAEATARARHASCVQQRRAARVELELTRVRVDLLRRTYFTMRLQAQSSPPSAHRADEAAR